MQINIQDLGVAPEYGSTARRFKVEAKGLEATFVVDNGFGFFLRAHDPLPDGTLVVQLCYGGDYDVYCVPENMPAGCFSYAHEDCLGWSAKELVMVHIRLLQTYFGE